MKIITLAFLCLNQLVQLRVHRRQVGVWVERLDGVGVGARAGDVVAGSRSGSDSR